MKELIIDSQKLSDLNNLVNSIPTNYGEQFVDVRLNLYDLGSGIVKYGLNWKSEMAEVNFSTLEEAFEIVRNIKARANPIRDDS